MLKIPLVRSKLRPLLKPSALNHTVRSNYSAEAPNNAFEDDFHKNHIQINPFQRTILGVGSALMSLADPHRADMVACLGETAGEFAIRYMRNKMENSDEGSEILKQRPRINTQTVDLDKLRKLPDGTLGKAYSNFLEHNKVTPDSRMTVRFIDDINLAYVLQRYREAHDLFHTVLGMPTNMLGEVTVKWVEAFQTKLPMCIGAAIFGPIRLKPKHRQLYREQCLPWAIETGKNSNFLLNVHFEKRWEQPVAELHHELNIKPLVLTKTKSKKSIKQDKRKEQ